MRLGPAAKGAAKPTGPEIGAPDLAVHQTVCLFVCSGVVGASSLQGALVPSGGQGVLLPRSS